MSIGDLIVIAGAWLLTAVAAAAIICGIICVALVLIRRFHLARPSWFRIVMLAFFAVGLGVIAFWDDLPEFPPEPIFPFG